MAAGPARLAHRERMGREARREGGHGAMGDRGGILSRSCFVFALRPALIRTGHLQPPLLVGAFPFPLPWSRGALAVVGLAFDNESEPCACCVSRASHGLLNSSHGSG